MPMVFVSSPGAGEPSDNTCTHIMNTVSDHDDHPTTTLRFGSGAVKHHARHRERMETETATTQHIRTRHVSRKRGSHRSDTAVSMPWLMNPSRLVSLIMTAGLIAVPLGLSAPYMSAKSAFAEQAGSQPVLATGASPLPAVAATYTPGVNNNLVADNTAVSNVKQDSVTVADTHDAHDTNAMSQASSSIPLRTKNPEKANVDTAIKLDSGALLHPGDPSRLPAVSAAASRSTAREPLDTTGILPALQTEVTGEFKLSTDEIDVDRMIGPSKDEINENNNATANDGNNDEGTNDTTNTANDVNHLGVSGVDTANTADTSDIDVKGHPTPVNTGDFGNAYPWGQCTWWAYVRRHQLGLAAASHFGNGGQWAYTARVLGYTVTSKPRVGDAVVFAPGQEGADGYYGHVAIVEHVNADGSILISESNVKGLGIISNRVISASSVPFLQYIK